MATIVKVASKVHTDVLLTEPMTPVIASGKKEARSIIIKGKVHPTSPLDTITEVDSELFDACFIPNMHLPLIENGLLYEIKDAVPESHGE